jgi:uncharacterized protein involved in exopolysaccharide biosynthesis
MIHQVIEKPRLLLRAWTVLRDGLPSRGRYGRYLKMILPPLLGIWGATAAYLMFAPIVYESNFTLILPGSGAGGTLNVESIGQAQSTSTSAFSSPTLSPTENYKRLLMADVTLRSAAARVKMEQGSFPDPQVKLIDQTNLIEVQVTGPAPGAAKGRALALRAAFLSQLDRLRRDEAEKREASDAKHLKALEAKVGEAQRKLISFQAANGLVSLDQFNSRIAGIDALREKEREARTALAQQAAETGRYVGVLGSGTGAANQMLRLKSDPVFQKLAERYAALDADAEQKSASLGKAHGEMALANGERQSLRKAMAKRGQQLTGLGEGAILRQMDLSVSDGRSSLMTGMVTSEVRKTGAQAALSAIRGDLSREGARANALMAQASVLADLTRDHRIAEAVFSSALARLDTNKQDPFASYPLVQTLEEPSLPKKPAAPSLLLALGGAYAASFFLLIGFGLLWLRQPLIRKLLPNG